METYNMPNSLKNQDFPEKTENSKEVILPLFHVKDMALETLDAQNAPKSEFLKSKHGNVTLNSEAEWNNYFLLQNNPSTNTTNKNKSKCFIYKDSNGMYRYTAQDENKYNGKELLGPIAKKIKEDLSKNIGSTIVKDIVLKESKDKDESNKVYPSTRVVLNNGGKEMNLANLLRSEMCKRYNVRSITFCYPNQGKTRGIRCRIDKNNTKIYEVANGSYEMKLTWNVEGKECEIKIGVDDNGFVELLENTSGVTWDELAAQKDVKVGRQYQAEFLYEALSYLEKEGGEIKVLSKESSERMKLAAKEKAQTAENLLELQQASSQATIQSTAMKI